MTTTNARLKEKLLRWLPAEGHIETAIPGLGLHRRDGNRQAVCCFYKPFVAVVLQGGKWSIIGNEEYRYGANDCLINGIDIPSVSHVVGATPEAPFLVITLDLDGPLIGQLAAEAFDARKMMDTLVKGTAVAPTDPEVLDAFWRLMKLLEKPEQIPALAPMIVREIHYRLLAGPQGEHLYSINTKGTQNNRIFQAITRMKRHFRERVEIDQLAREVGMAPSTFRRYFKTVTTMSPLQYQKQLRLYEAHRLMLAENADATRASYAVGYESATQFNREYKRLFGEAPGRLRKIAGFHALQPNFAGNLRTGANTVMPAHPFPGA